MLNGSCVVSISLVHTGAPSSYGPASIPDNEAKMDAVVVRVMFMAAFVAALLWTTRRIQRAEVDDTALRRAFDELFKGDQDPPDPRALSLVVTIPGLHHALLDSRSRLGRRDVQAARELWSLVLRFIAVQARCMGSRRRFFASADELNEMIARFEELMASATDVLGVNMHDTGQVILDHLVECVRVLENMHEHYIIDEAHAIN